MKCSIKLNFKSTDISNKDKIIRSLLDINKYFLRNVQPSGAQVNPSLIPTMNCQDYFIFTQHSNTNNNMAIAIFNPDDQNYTEEKNNQTNKMYTTTILQIINEYLDTDHKISIANDCNLELITLRDALSLIKKNHFLREKSPESDILGDYQPLVQVLPTNSKTHLDQENIESYIESHNIKYCVLSLILLTTFGSIIFILITTYVLITLLLLPILIIVAILSISKIQRRSQNDTSPHTTTNNTILNPA